MRENAISGEPPKKGGILDALRRSPLVGADLDLGRPVTHGRNSFRAPAPLTGASDGPYR